MSTKIYNGYRLSYTTNVVALVRELNKKILPVYQELALQAVAITASMLCPELDEKTVYSTDRERLQLVTAFLSNDQVKQREINSAWSLWSQAAGLVDSIQQCLKKDYPKRVPTAVDLSDSVVFVSDPEYEEWLYALSYTEREEFTKIWEELPGVEYYPYWNNSDPPDEVSDDEWRIRERVWDRVLGYDPPANIGVTWEVEKSPLFVHSAGIGNTKWLTAEKGIEKISEIFKNPERWEKVKDAVTERITGPAIQITEKITGKEIPKDKTIE